MQIKSFLYISGSRLIVNFSNGFLQKLKPTEELCRGYECSVYLAVPGST